jgi:hypothetical protein
MRNWMRKWWCRLWHQKHHENYWTEFSKYFWRCRKCGVHFASKRK